MIKKATLERKKAEKETLKERKDGDNKKKMSWIYVIMMAGEWRTEVDGKR
jgi:hypothetical protein